MKVCFVANRPAPYKLALFEEMSKYVEMYVVLHDTMEANRNKEWGTTKEHNYKLFIICEDYKKMINKIADECDILLNGVYMSSYGYLACSAFKKRNKPTVLFADGGLINDRGFLINKFQSYMMNRYDYFLSSCPFTNDYFKYYGVDLSKVYMYRQTSLTDQIIINHRKMSKNKEAYRKELGFDDKFTIISIGQPVKRKGFDILLKSYINSGLTNEINVYIIGGEPQEEIKEIASSNSLVNVHFVGLLSSSEVNKYYAACDAFMLCTREDTWGLVIQEALSFGKPVITSDNCVAGVHYASVCKSTIVCGVNDIDSYSNAIKNIYNNKNNLKKLSEDAFKVIEDCTIEKSSDDLIEASKQILKVYSK